MIRDILKTDILKAAKKLGLGVEDVELVRPTDPKNGDYSTNIALKIGIRVQKPETRNTKYKTGNWKLETGDTHDNSQSPIEFAKKMADSFKNHAYIEKLEVKEPGFLNFFIKDNVWQGEVEKVLKSEEKYGSNSLNKGKKSRVEFVSANPTGPLHFGNARGGPIGDALASVLEFSGYSVVREYYHNDLGGQVEKLGQAILKVAAGGKLEDQEYKGEYVRGYAHKIGKEILKKLPKSGVGSISLDLDRLAGGDAIGDLLSKILEDCEAMGIKFDKVYKESKFIEDGETEKALDKINKFLKRKDGAVWFAPSDDFLKDRETVVVKSDETYTYFANDIAYHDLKFKDDPDLVIDVFGANHHGHVPRLQAVIKALGYDVSKFHVILYQWVRFKRGGELVKMSKRAGTFVTAREVLDEIGRDALRFFILMHDANSPIDFDLDLAREKSNKNPVYYVQYAHARICAILAMSKLKTQSPKLNHELLATSFELNLIKQITRFPELVKDISKNFAVNQLTTYARELADSFHKFYENCRVVGEEKELEEARIALIKATKITLENTLRLLGISAPEKM